MLTQITQIKLKSRASWLTGLLLGVTLGQIFGQINIMWTKQVRNLHAEGLNLSTALCVLDKWNDPCMAAVWNLNTWADFASSTVFQKRVSLSPHGEYYIKPRVPASLSWCTINPLWCLSCFHSVTRPGTVLCENPQSGWISMLTEQPAEDTGETDREKLKR